jgi:hypothetical protein
MLFSNNNFSSIFNIISGVRRRRGLEIGAAALQRTSSKQAEQTGAEPDRFVHQRGIGDDWLRI